MKTKIVLTFAIVTVMSLSFFACSKMEDDVDPQAVELSLPETPFDYTTSGLGGIILNTGVNNDQATLGRVLFYDKHLSVNNAISCGTCHKQSIAFSDNVPFSPGFENHPTLRNTLPIQNVSNTSFFGFGNPSLFWDGRTNFLQSMVLMPITNHVEMGMSDINAIVEKVKAQSYYKTLFVKAYGNDNINTTTVAQALSSFVSAIVSGSTKFDKVNNQMSTLSTLEQEGFNLFFNKYDCNSCHQTTQLNGYEMGGGFVNIGLETDYTDKGHQNVTNIESDNGKFKIPNLRNIALTGPYMHDGRFTSLDEVLEHYSHGIQNHPALDPRLRTADGQARQMNITAHEKTAIIAFLNTLTDFNMITDPKFSNPFQASK